MYERLGFLERIRLTSERTKYKYSVSKKETPIQLCSAREFRNLISGNNGIVRKNSQGYGIPQGSPISDLLANLYLIDFDVMMNRYAQDQNGYYFRYSDGLILILPGDDSGGHDAQSYASNKIMDCGDKLEIKEKKSSIRCFSTTSDSRITYQYVSGNLGKTGLEYLGFRFDGKSVCLRESTLSRFHRKIRQPARSRARKLVKRYWGKGEDFLVEAFNTPKFIQRFSRVKDFHTLDNYHDWTFWTYVQRAIDVFGSSDRKIYRQLSNHTNSINKSISKELHRAMSEYN